MCDLFLLLRTDPPVPILLQLGLMGLIALY